MKSLNKSNRTLTVCWFNGQLSKLLSAKIIEYLIFLVSVVVSGTHVYIKTLCQLSIWGQAFLWFKTGNQTHADQSSINQTQRYNLHYHAICL